MTRSSAFDEQKSTALWLVASDVGDRAEVLLLGPEALTGVLHASGLLKDKLLELEDGGTP